MTVKRMPNPTGLLADAIHIDMDATSIKPEEIDWCTEMMEAKCPASRVERLRRHHELRATADSLATRLHAAGGNTDASIRAELCEAESRALYLDAAPALIRDRKRQDGTHKPRGSKMPRLDSWLNDRLSKNRELSTDDLWQALPNSYEREDVFRDDQGVSETDEKDRVRNEKPLQLSGFGKRVTAARKKLKKPVSN